MMSLLAGTLDIDDPGIQLHFVGPHVAYQVPRCKMIFFPDMLKDRWVCYAWRLSDNQIIYYDPMPLRSSSGDPYYLHVRVIRKLKDVMARLSRRLFTRWDLDWNAASVLPFPREHIYNDRWNISGALCAHFCWCFDGEKLRTEARPVKHQFIAGNLLMRILDLTDNDGEIPEFFLKRDGERGK